MVDGLSCIQDAGKAIYHILKGINQLNPQNLSSTTTAAKGKKKKKKRTKKELESPPPLKQSTKKLSLGYTEIGKRRRRWGKISCVI